jgi:hypothetical protein
MTTTSDAPAAEQPTAPDPGAVRAALTREAVLAALADTIKAELADARTDTQHLLDQQAKATGSTKFDATLPDGVKVGSVSVTGGEAEAKIVDEEAFTDWVRETYPSEAVTQIVRSVRATFTAQILAEMTAARVARIVDKGTGEMHDVPGVAIKPSRARSHRLTFARKSKAQPLDGRDLIAQSWRTGDLASIVLPALAPAPATAEEATP